MLTENMFLRPSLASTPRPASPLVIARAPLKIPATSRAELGAVLERLRRGAPEFARLPMAQRISLLHEISEGYATILEPAIREGCRIKGLDPDSEAAGEEWFAHGFCAVRHMRLLEESLTQILRDGAPRIDPDWIRNRPNGALSILGYPLSGLESLAFPGIQAEIWMGKSVTRENLRAHQASFYRAPHDGRVALVLGAGNVASIPTRDSLTKMFNEGKVVVLKMNPVNEYLGPFLERAFRPAIDRGYFAVVYGGGEEGNWLAQHPLVDEVHITGSDRTHDSIVWGPPGPERERRVRRHEPMLNKEISSELGNVTAVIVVPGPWSARDVQRQARNVAGMVANNASFNCNSAKLLVQSRDWSQRAPMLQAVESALASVPPRLAYYPGAAERFRRLTAGHPETRLVGRPGAGELPWAIVPGLDPGDATEPLFRQEPWCSILGETALEEADPKAFLAEAVRFVNERVWGTLCVTLLVHPATVKDPATAAALERALEDLRYGTVAVNLWPAVGFSLGTTPWGAHPSGTLADIQSGRGFVGNTLMLEGVEKVVLRGRFRMLPKPVWFPGHRTLATMGRRATELERTGSWLKLPRLALAALRG